MQNVLKYVHSLYLIIFSTVYALNFNILYLVRAGQQPFIYLMLKAFWFHQLWHRRNVCSTSYVYLKETKLSIEFLEMKKKNIYLFLFKSILYGCQYCSNIFFEAGMYWQRISKQLAWETWAMLFDARPPCISMLLG